MRGPKKEVVKDGDVNDTLDLQEEYDEDLDDEDSIDEDDLDEDLDDEDMELGDEDII